MILGLLITLATVTPTQAHRVMEVGGMRLVLTESVASRWSSTDHLKQPPSPVTTSITIGVDRLLVGNDARIDLFDRSETGCNWKAAFRGPTGIEFAIPSSTRAQCILVRNGSIYGLATITAGKTSARVAAVRDIQPISAREQVLFVEGEDEPRFLDRDGIFAAVPAVPSLVCEWGPPDAERCARIEPHESKPSGSAMFVGSASGVRVVHAPTDITIQVFSEARSVLAPRKERPSTIRVGAWHSVAINLPWERVIVDWVQEGRATVRTSDSDLRPLPAFLKLASHATSGVAVRPLLGKEGEIVVEAEAQLAFFHDRPGIVGKVAAAVVGGDDDGVFRVSHLAPGEYRMKLMSALAADAVVRAIVSSDVTDVRFPVGPIVRGRIVLRSTATASGLPVIRIMALAGDAHADPASKQIDPAQLAREVVSDSEGVFRVSLPAGEYILRASWAGGTAERVFRIDGRRDVDLGAIELTRAVNLRGTLVGCDGGEIRLTPLPAPTRRTALPLFDHRRSPIHEGGRFEVASLWAGQWLASARCGGEERLLTPRVVDVPENAQADLVVQFGFGAQ